MKFFERIGQKKRVAEIVNKEYERYQKSKENEKPLAELHPEVKKALIENAEKALLGMNEVEIKDAMAPPGVVVPAREDA